MASRRKTSRQLYAEPKVYDAAFSWDTTVELEFYSTLLDEYSNLDSKSRLIEFACGTGRILRVLSNLGCFIVGLDVSPSMASFARKKTPSDRTDFAVADMASVPAKPGSFAAALCTLSSINYLSSITSVEEHLREASRILTSDGTCIIDFLLGIPVKTREEWETVHSEARYRVRWSIQADSRRPDELREDISISSNGRPLVRNTSSIAIIRRAAFHSAAERAGFRLERWFKPFSKTGLRRKPSDGRVVVVLTK